MPRRSTRSSCCRGRTRSARPGSTPSTLPVRWPTRYGADGRVRELASGVVPVAGLIAETGATLREEQFRWLRTLAALPEVRRDDLLLSADRFRDPDGNPLGEEIREELLARLGMFGLRLAVQLLADGTAGTSTELSAVAPRAVRDPRAPAHAERALRPARPGPQGTLRAGGPAGDRPGARPARDRRRVGRRRVGRSARGVVTGPCAVAAPAPRAHRRRRALPGRARGGGPPVRFGAGRGAHRDPGRQRRTRSAGRRWTPSSGGDRVRPAR